GQIISSRSCRLTPPSKQTGPSRRRASSSVHSDGSMAHKLRSGNPVGGVGWTANRSEPQRPLSSPSLASRSAATPSTTIFTRYRLDDCRNAIAHSRRRPGRAGLNLDVREERSRFARSTWVVQAFAQHYIRTRLALTEYVYLMRPRSRGVPRFVDVHTLRTGRFR